MKKFLIAAGVAAALAAPLAHAQKIGLAMSEQDTFLSIMSTALVNHGKEVGAQVQLETAEKDIGKQLSQVQNFIAQKVDAIIINPVDTDATPKMTKMVTEAHIPLVYVNRKPVDFDKLPDGVAFVASDERVSGTLEAKEVCRVLKGKGNIVVLMGDLANEAARTRTKDVEDVVKTPECSGIKILDKREGKWSRTSAQDIVTNWLSAGLKFDAVVANNDEMALGAINALKASKKWTPDYMVAGVDATPDALASMKNGEIKVTVFQNAAGQGKGAVDAALKLIKHQKVDRFVNIPFELVTPANMAQYAK
ncbi:MAG TPA: sugar ABC transporter substrate-binding protein [Burkholderiaceae bacterium]|nr:sugar ABC transporter substrate-binding protein [Burkholderiaceae bacterium]